MTAEELQAELDKWIPRNQALRVYAETRGISTKINGASTIFLEYPYETVRVPFADGKWVTFYRPDDVLRWAKERPKPGGMEATNRCPLCNERVAVQRLAMHLTLDCDWVQGVKR